MPCDKRRVSFFICIVFDLQTVLHSAVSRCLPSPWPSGARSCWPLSGPMWPLLLQGSPRHQVQQYMASMAVAQQMGPPSYFVTITCSSKWPEFAEFIKPGMTASDRPEIVARIFQMKLKQVSHPAFVVLVCHCCCPVACVARCRALHCRVLHCLLCMLPVAARHQAH